MKKILHILWSLKKNGTETFVMNVFREIDRKKFHFDFLVFSDEKDGFFEEINQLGGKVHFLPSRKKGIINYHKALDIFFENHAYEYEAVHQHGMSLSSIAPLRYAKKYGVKKIITHIHGTSCHGYHNKLLHHLNRGRIHKYATHFLGCSHKALKWGFDKSPAIKNSELVINGISLNKFLFNRKTREEKRKELGLNEDLTLIHVGSFNKIKNHSFILDIMKELVKLHPYSKLILIGEGYLEEQIKAKSDNLGLRDKVLFLSRREDVNEILNAADIMVMPSLHEGIPFSLIEAQTNDVPIVASDTISTETKFKDNYLSLPLSLPAEEWATTILNLYNSSLNHKRGEAECNNPYSIVNTVNQLIDIYNEI